MNLSLEEWRAEQGALRARAEAVLSGQTPLSELLAPWPIEGSEAALRRLAPLGEPPETEDMAALVAWADGAHLCDGPPQPAAAWDQLALRAHAPSTPRSRQIAALTLLARLGAAYRRREHDAPRARAWAPLETDGAIARSWRALLHGPPAPLTEGPLYRCARSAVKSSFQGVATVLRLPPEVARDLSNRAMEQLDLALPLARGELASWVVETAGEPVEALATAMGPRVWETVRACAAGRSLWVEVREALERPVERHSLAAGAAGTVLRRLCAGLAEGRAQAHELGLPGWAVVASNRARIRGRLRAAAAQDPAALAKTLDCLACLSARSADALGRFGWGWAWREARSGFGMDLDRISAPACAVPPPLAMPAPPLGMDHEAALRTLLLLIAGRGCWSDLERWVEGGVGRELNRSFYRCLDAAPDSLADADPGRRSRGYERLRAWLFDGGLESALPMLAEAAARVRPLPVSRDLRARMREALSPWWDESAVEFPQHHLPGFREALLDARFSSPPGRTPEGSPP